MKRGLLPYLIFLILSCKSKSSTVSIQSLDFNSFPLENLSEYGFFKGEIKQLIPEKDIIEYEPLSPLFSDYAFKKRFVWMPKGTYAKVNIQSDQAFDFPDKTILIKNFYYPKDFSKPEKDWQLIETRLLIKYRNEWKAYPYVWNENQNDASLKLIGGIIETSWKDNYGVKQEINYVVPNKNQCKNCHNQNEQFVPLGLKLKQLNHEVTYENEKLNQLELWQKMGYLENSDSIKSKIVLSNYSDSNISLEKRARSYLDSNCGFCHNAFGPASTSGLYLNYEENNSFHLGILKSPVAAGIGAGPYKFDIYPGKGNESILTYRMNSTNPGVMMPEIGRVSVHKEAVVLIKEWIDQLK